MSTLRFLTTTVVFSRFIFTRIGWFGSMSMEELAITELETPDKKYIESRIIFRNILDITALALARPPMASQNESREGYF